MTHTKTEEKRQQLHTVCWKIIRPVCWKAVRKEKKEEWEGAKSWNEEFSNMKTPQPPTESFTSANNWQYEQTASYKSPQLVTGWEAMS